MPRPEIKYLPQEAVLWVATGVDKYNEPTLDPPIEIQVRWEYVATEVSGPEGTPVGIDAKVITDTEIPNGSLMWLGTLEDWYGVGSADSEEAKVMQSQMLTWTPTLRARHISYEYGLKFFRRGNPL